MTNEELVLLIKGGKNEYIPELWERVYRLIYKWALRYCNFTDGDAKYSIDDLVQSGYFALLNAVNDYTGTTEYKFTTYLFYHCRTEFRLVLGIHTSRKEIPTVSIDESLTEDDDFTLSDTLVDESAEQALQEIDDILYQEYCHEMLSCAISTLSQIQQHVITLRYYENLTFSAIGEQMNCSSQYVRTVEREALRNLRRGRAYTYLRELDTRHTHVRGSYIDVYSYSGSVGSWHSTGASSTERAMFELMKHADEK